MNNPQIPKYVKDAMKKYKGFELAVKYYPNLLQHITPNNINAEIALYESRYASWGEQKFIEAMMQKNSRPVQQTSHSVEILGRSQADVYTAIMGKTNDSKNPPKKKGIVNLKHTDPSVDTWTSFFGG